MNAPWQRFGHELRRTIVLLRPYWRELLLLSLVTGPFVALLALGTVFLWQQGWLTYWALSVVVCTVVPLITVPFWRPRPHGVTIAPAEPHAPAAEQQARAALHEVVARVSAADLCDTEHVRQLALRTINAVAAAYAPETAASADAAVLSRAALRFTLPEALLLGEDLSRRLRATLLEQVPLVRHVQLGWALETYERGVAVAVPMQRLYRALRWVNPVAALGHELRDLVLSQAFAQLGSAARVQVAALIAREIGTAAIDLYAGRYRRRADEPLPIAPSAQIPTPPEPLTVLLAGRLNTGKSSLLNALLGIAQVPVGPVPSTGVFAAYRFALPANAMQTGGEDTAPADANDELVLVDSPGLTAAPDAAWLRQARASDLILWVTAANRADRAGDRRALAALRALTAGDPRLCALPMVLVLTHADRLDPPLEWAPPYDPVAGTSAKERTMRAAWHAAAETLDFPLERCVLVAVPPDSPPWNLDGLWATIQRALPAARRKQLERGLRPDGWFTLLADGARSLPGAVDFLKERLTRPR